MISSGIKRGLAATAISALAVTGLPALALTASAAPGDAINVAFTGPARNAGADGAVVVLEVSEGTVTPALIKATATAAANAGSQNSPDQTVTILSRTLVADNAGAGSNEFGDDDGFDEITLRVAVTTPAAGATASFRVFEDDTTNDTLDAAEARAAVAIQTAGPVAEIAVSPSSQTSSAGVASGPYTVTLKDAAGRTTQQNSGGQITINPDGATTNESGNVITADESARGTDTFTATGPVIDVYNMTLTAGLNPEVTGTATLDVVKTAIITAPEVDIVTAADSWAGFGDGGDGFSGGTTAVRVDQNSIRIDIRSTNLQADAHGTVVLQVSGNGVVTFGGQNTTTVTTVLDANGIGSLTITPDAGTVQEGDSIDVSGDNFDQTFNFQRAAVSEIVAGADRYVSAIDGAVTVTAHVVDQFGNPASGGEMSAARRGGPNAPALQRKVLDANGEASFTFTDANAVPGQVETVDFYYYTDQFDATGAFLETTTIRYTVDGQGADFSTDLNGITASGLGYNPANVRVIPLADTSVDQNSEAIDLDVEMAEPNAPITVSVNNGALILEPGETRLSQGSASITDQVTAGGTLPAGYQVIGTKSGLTTLTIDSANRTETAQFTVTGQSDTSMARNVAVSGPATANAGALATFTAVVTDAFGNTIEGIHISELNIQVSGPGALQDNDAFTDANGSIALNVRLTDEAAGPVSIKVTGIPNFGSQFGAAADRLFEGSTTDDGRGLTVSSNVATATVTAVAGPTNPPGSGPRVPSGLTVKGYGHRGGSDTVIARAINDAAGAKATLFRKNKNGVWKQIASAVLNAKGNHQFGRVKDKNGLKVTKYKVKITKTALTKRASGGTTLR